MAEPETTNTTTEKKKRTSRKKRTDPSQSLKALLWAAADKLGGHMDAAEIQARRPWPYLPEVHLRCIRRTRRNLEAQISDPANELYVEKPHDRYATLEDRDEYTAANIFWVPKRGRNEAHATVALQECEEFALGNDRIDQKV